MSWVSELSPIQRNALIGAGAGWAVDGFDFVLYSFVIPTLITQWAMSRGQAGFIATAALLTSAVGGWAAGILADRYGRVRVLQLTILWFSVCTFVCGLTDSFAELAAVRALQGFGFGGEWTVGAVLVSEMIGVQHRGKAVGVMQSGYAVGWALATCAFAFFFSWLPEHYAWRALFITGLLPALLVIYLRSKVTEPAVFVRSLPSSARISQGPSFLEIFSRPFMGTLLLTSLLAIGIQGAYYAVVIWLPTYLNSVRHLSVLDSGGDLLVLIAGSFFGYLSGAASMDRFGRRKTLITFALLSALTAYSYFSCQLPTTIAKMAGFPLGFTVSAMIGGLGAFLAELFPTRVRAAAQGFSYNCGRVVAASFPPLIGSLSAAYSLASMMMVFALGSFTCVIIASALLPETKGRSLDTIRD